MIESRYLKDNIENIQKLMQIPALRHFEVRSLSRLLRLSKIREYDDGEFIIRDGDEDTWLYFLLGGSVRIEKNGHEISTIHKMGEIFGEMRLIDKRARSADVVAAGTAVCLAVDTSAKNHMAGEEGSDAQMDFLLLLYKIFAEYLSARLRLANEELVKAKEETETLKKGPDVKK
ncbi:Cyclic nucleotide-binding domain-containing protein [Desulfobotulus alkaliphilus]|uniref:Cyclic nucleotide-binding domain-containing protein n=1 Tax=Desulfobotulus alkaliphilus TaxID=622671 RepID=A0A562S2Q5_9BACT|nr:cyclic nucleotide-binding domain-containing protein [Desulfobotulus alkaliphilus]TWI75659.1 Cyclic nucleotide-binding domain-containing protein [Desulfobotulus alkaliphilus]